MAYSKHETTPRSVIEKVQARAAQRQKGALEDLKILKTTPVPLALIEIGQITAQEKAEMDTLVSLLRAQAGQAPEPQSRPHPKEPAKHVGQASENNRPLTMEEFVATHPAVSQLQADSQTATRYRLASIADLIVRRDDQPTEPDKVYRFLTNCKYTWTKPLPATRKPERSMTLDQTLDFLLHIQNLGKNAQYTIRTDDSPVKKGA